MQKKQQVSEEEKEKKKNKIMLENYDDILDVIMQMAYIEIFTHDRKFISYEEWLSTMDKIDINQEWVGEVVSIATNCFC